MILLRIPSIYQRHIARKLAQRYLLEASYTTAVTIDAIDAITHELLQRHRNKAKNNLFNVNDLSLRYFMKADNNEPKKDVTALTAEELDNLVVELFEKHKHKLLKDTITECHEKKILISENALKKLFRSSSMSGKVDTVLLLQKYSMKIDPYLFKRNGEFLHYVAKAQCMKGNSEKGLFILKQCYEKFDGLRSFYRIILRELIQDTVLNRSEASLVVFKKYMLEFSEKYKDHYPLVCFWYNCWSSTWFSDQMLADELLESSKFLQDIVKDKATAFSITILREYNDDAVLRLLQNLIKYKMMDEYVKVLQVLFAYKLRNRDLHGCTEIVRNCEALGLSLPMSQQGKYIKMLINNKEIDGKIIKPNFKLKF
ncbi:uncharacterized protein [Epargyreus clarus]|uniref:uncharacterized protein n=1 Tax=Epargyreus clarus TaxID=520877 RepID=UPI003C2D4DFA